MTPEVSTLREAFVAICDWALERPNAGVFSKVVPQVTCFAEDRVAVVVAAAEENFQSFRCWVAHFDHLVPG